MTAKPTAAEIKIVRLRPNLLFLLITLLFNMFKKNKQDNKPGSVVLQAIPDHLSESSVAG